MCQATVPASLKWGKQFFSGLSLQPASSGHALKQEIYALTGVPTNRQKLMCRGAWTGALKDGDVINESLTLSSGQSELVIMLIGTADAVPAPPEEKVKFIEDLSPEEVASEAAASAAAELMAAEGMIIALQKLPGERGDNKMDKYKYNSLVFGLPQRQIEDKLRARREDGSSSLLGVCAMTLGLELGRAYVNNVAVLHDGTLVSVMDDGQVHLWRHCVRTRCAFHTLPEPMQAAGAGAPGGVTCLAPITQSAEHSVAFATGGNACINLWTVEGDYVTTLMAPVATTPIALVAVPTGSSQTSYLAAAFRRARPFDPSTFRLVPQNEEERRRRALAEAAEEALRQRLAEVTRSAIVWSLKGGVVDGAASSIDAQPFVVGVGEDDAGTRLTAIVSLFDANAAHLICGDELGGIRVWREEQAGSAQQEGQQWRQTALLQLQHWDEAASSAREECLSTTSIVCMVSLISQTATIAVSTEQALTAPSVANRHLSGASILRVASSRAVFLIDVIAHNVLVAIDAHQDAVRCMCATPDGGLLTGGGKHDAKVYLWQRTEIAQAASSTQDVAECGSMRTPVLSNGLCLKEPGYVFSMAILPDSKPGSKLFALAAARYNVVKLCL